MALRKVIGVITARMASTPSGEGVRKMAGKSVLHIMSSACCIMKGLDGVFLATSVDPKIKN